MEETRPVQKRSRDVLSPNWKDRENQKRKIDKHFSLTKSSMVPPRPMTPDYGIP